MITVDDLKKIKNGQQGQPRAVVHFTHLLTEGELADYEYNGSVFTSNYYNQAVKNAKQFGGRKYNTVEYPNRIAFSHYNLTALCKQINEFLEHGGY